MLYFDRIDAPEGNDVIKTSASKKCNIYQILKKSLVSTRFPLVKKIY